MFANHLRAMQELREKMQRQLKKASSFQVCVALLSPLLRQWLNVQDGDEVRRAPTQGGRGRAHTQVKKAPQGRREEGPQAKRVQGPTHRAKERRRGM